MKMESKTNFGEPQSLQCVLLAFSSSLSPMISVTLWSWTDTCNRLLEFCFTVEENSDCRSSTTGFYTKRMLL